MYVDFNRVGELVLHQFGAGLSFGYSYGLINSPLLEARVEQKRHLPLKC